MVCFWILKMVNFRLTIIQPACVDPMVLKILYIFFIKHKLCFFLNNWTYSKLKAERSTFYTRSLKDYLQLQSKDNQIRPATGGVQVIFLAKIWRKSNYTLHRPDLTVNFKLI